MGCRTTVSTHANQVLPPDNRITMMGWTGSPIDGIGVASQSLARDLSLSPSYELLQAFVPELQALRIAGSERHLQCLSGKTKRPAEGCWAKGSLRIEIVAVFWWTAAKPTEPFGVSWLGGAGNLSVDCTSKSATGEAPGGCMVSTVSSTNNTGVTGSTMPVLPVATSVVRIHTIVDHSVIETVVNNRSAMVSWSVNARSAAQTDVGLFGGSDVNGTITTWDLRDTGNNNATNHREL